MKLPSLDDCECPVNGESNCDLPDNDDDACVDLSVCSSKKKTKKKKKKIYRPCPFCDRSAQDLRRHLITTHKREEKVKTIIEAETNGIITKQERIRQFNNLKKEGIRKNNQILLAQDSNTELLGERCCKGEKVMCLSCHGFFKKAYFSRHRKNCAGACAVPVKTEHHISLKQSDTVDITDEFSKEWNSVLEEMRHDQDYDIIIADDIIRIIGKDMFAARKPNKHREAKVKARIAMRRLAKLKVEAQVRSVEKLFHVDNITRLVSSIEKMCKGDTKMKAGLKLALGTLVKQCCGILITHYSVTGQDDIAETIRRFKEVFSSPVHYAKLMATAEYSLKEKRQRENRKPSHLPDENQLATFVNYIDDELAKIKPGEIFTKSSFVHMRKITLARITLLNARRGSEAARLLVSDWQDRHTWIDRAKLTEEDFRLLQQYSVAFVMGKGDKLLPVFFPSNCQPALEMLANSAVRQQAGVSEDNPFLFAYTDESKHGAVGYNDIKDLCQQLQIKVITATSMRHRASTAFWKMQATESQVNWFMEHIGHSRAIDENVYACPPALKAMRMVTPILERINTMPSASIQNEFEQKTEAITNTSGGIKRRHGSESNRSYTKWTESASQEIYKAFSHYIAANSNVYPGKEEILKFQSQVQNAQIQEMEWETIKTKIVNECVKAKRRLQKIKKAVVC